MTHPTPMLRAALPEDAGQIAALHLRVWRQTYGTMAPAEAVARLDKAHRLAQWQKALADGAPGAGAIVAVDMGHVMGVVGFGPAPQAPFNGRAEIRHLYVDEPARGTGLGQRLLKQAFAQLAKAGFHAVALAVVGDNHAARAFYRAMGGTEEAAFVDPGPLWRSQNILVAWPLPA